MLQRGRGTRLLHAHCLQAGDAPALSKSGQRYIFQDVTQSAGVAAAARSRAWASPARTSTATVGPIIYVANDGAANLLWLNNGNGTFREAALLSGAAYSADGVARAGMGVTAGDFDGTGTREHLRHQSDQGGRHPLPQQRPWRIHRLHPGIPPLPADVSVHGLRRSVVRL